MDSDEAMTGSYTVVVKASGGRVRREARFGLEVIAVFEPPYESSRTKGDPKGVGVRVNA